MSGHVRTLALCAMAAFALTAIAAASANAATPNPEIGQCLAVKTLGLKKGLYKNSTCTETDIKVTENKKTHEKTETPDGKYEFKAGTPLPCVPAAKGTKGFYKNSTCTEKDEKNGAPKGKYEKQGPGFKSTSGPATFYNYEAENESDPTKQPQGVTLTKLGGTVKCSASTATGTITGTRETKQTITFTGCESAHTQCATPGQAAGTIKMNEVAASLVLLPQGKGIGSFINRGNEAGHPSAKVVCGKVVIAIESAQVLGVVGGDISTPSTTSTGTWAVTSPSEGVEKERYYEEHGEVSGGPYERWESSLENYEEEESFQFCDTGFEAAFTNTFEAALEVKV